MENIPLTRAIALTYFVSIVFWELISILARITAPEARPNPPPSQQTPPTTTGPESWSISALQLGFDIHDILAQKIIHGLMAIGVTHLVPTLSQMQVGWALLLGTLCMALPLAVFHALLWWAAPTTYHQGHAPITGPGGFFTSSAEYLAGIFTALDTGTSLLPRYFLFPMLMIHPKLASEVFSSEGFLFAMLTWVLAEMNVRLLMSTLLMVLSRALVEVPLLATVIRVRTLDEGRAVVVCVSTLVGGLGCYCAIYDPTGTVNPTWTDIFG
jgi:hypothetical protein